MSLGTGIFLSTLVFALLYLYKITRDRWNWRRAAQRTLVALSVIIAVAALGAVGVFVFEKIGNVPHQQTGYDDLRLGMTMAEVKYVKGFPPNVVDKNDKDTWGGWRVIKATKDDLKEKRVDDFALWLYDRNDQTRLDVDFDLKKGTVNSIGCFSNGVMDCPPLVGIQDGTTEEIVLQKLGKPSHERIEGVSKRMYFEDLRVWFDLTQNKVYMMGVQYPAAVWWARDAGAGDPAPVPDAAKVGEIRKEH
jgi:hypothetical protein